MKKCSKCGETKDLSSFHKSKKAGYQAWCKPCVKEYDRQWFQDNKYKRRRQASSHKKSLMNRQQALKTVLPCTDCKQYYHPAAMDWDHIDPSIKIGNVSTFAAKGYSTKMAAEINKCEPVCSNCHRVREYNKRLAA